MVALALQMRAHDLTLISWRSGGAPSMRVERSADALLIIDALVLLHGINGEIYFSRRALSGESSIKVERNGSRAVIRLDLVMQNHGMGAPVNARDWTIALLSSGIFCSSDDCPECACIRVDCVCDRYCKCTVTHHRSRRLHDCSDGTPCRRQSPLCHMCRCTCMHVTVHCSVTHRNVNPWSDFDGNIIH